MLTPRLHKLQILKLQFRIQNLENSKQNFEPKILFSTFSLIFYHIFLKHKCELRVNIFEFLMLILKVSVMKFANDSESYVCNKAYSQVQFFTYELINTYEYVETFRLHFDPAYCIEYMNPDSYFNLLLLLSCDISFSEGPIYNDQAQLEMQLECF